MNWLFITILAQIILGTSAVFDKLLLKRKFFDPLVYTFWLGLLGIFAIIALPFGFELLSLNIIIIAIIAGALFILAMLFLFYALDYSEASATLPIIGSFSPVFTLVISYFLVGSFLGFGELLAFFFLILGSIVLFIAEKKELRFLSFIFITASALFFGLSNVLSKIVFQAGPFISGFVLIKIGGVIFVLFLLLRKSFRQRIFSSSRQAKIKYHFLYFANRAYAGAGSILVYFAISLAHPAIVDAIQSLKYIVIFFCAWFLLKERFKGKILAGKIIATIFIAFGILLLGLTNYSRNIPVTPAQKIDWGITFSAKYSRQLGLDWQKNFKAILDELKSNKIRLIAYWDEIEREKDNYNFSDLDWQLKEAEKTNAKIILAVGMKAPRWPECHIPDWAKSISTDEREKELQKYLREVIKRYQKYSILEAWQVENEPFLLFGECPERGKDFLPNEIALVKTIDSIHPIIVTDGGEFGLWYKAAKNGDIFGTTMYRRVHNKFFGNIDYGLPPSFFILKEKVTRFLLGDYNKKFITIELSAEPWMQKSIYETPISEQFKFFDYNFFKDTISYAKKTGFNEYYFWGAEWWYYLKINGYPEIWDEAKNLWQ